MCAIKLKPALQLCYFYNVDLKVVTCLKILNTEIMPIFKQGNRE